MLVAKARFVGLVGRAAETSRKLALAKALRRAANPARQWRDARILWPGL